MLGFDKKVLARPGDVFSNDIFEVLQDWRIQLQDFEGEDFLADPEEAVDHDIEPPVPGGPC